MIKESRRREFLTRAGSAGVILLAGCSVGDNEQLAKTSTPDKTAETTANTETPTTSTASGGNVTNTSSYTDYLVAGQSIKPQSPLIHQYAEIDGIKEFYGGRDILPARPGPAPPPMVYHAIVGGNNALFIGGLFLSSVGLGTLLEQKQGSQFGAIDDVIVGPILALRGNIKTEKVNEELRRVPANASNEVRMEQVAEIGEYQVYRQEETRDPPAKINPLAVSDTDIISVEDIEHLRTVIKSLQNDNSTETSGLDEFFWALSETGHGMITLGADKASISELKQTVGDTAEFYHPEEFFNADTFVSSIISVDDKIKAKAAAVFSSLSSSQKRAIEEAYGNRAETFSFKSDGDKISMSGTYTRKVIFPDE